MVDVVKWCNLCQGSPAHGRLQAILIEGGEPEWFDVCVRCVAEIPGENWDSNKNPISR